MRRGLGALLLCTALAGVAAAHDGATVDLARLDARLATDPHDVEARLDRVDLHRRMGMLEQALADLRVIEQRAPATRRLWLERALVRRALGNAAGAEADLDRFLEAGEPSRAALIARAELREQAGKLALARQDYDTAIALRATPELVLARGRLDEKLGALERAAAGYEGALKQLGGALTVRLALIGVERARKRHTRALAHASELVSQSPMKAQWLLLRAEIHADAGNRAAASRDRLRALAEAERAVSRRPTPLLRVLKARSNLALGRRGAARRELELALAQAPALEEARALLATLGEQEGKTPR